MLIDEKTGVKVYPNYEPNELRPSEKELHDVADRIIKEIANDISF